MEVSRAALVGSSGRLIRGFADRGTGTTNVARKAILPGIAGSRLQLPELDLVTIVSK